MTRRWLANGAVLAVLWLFVRGVPASPPVRLVEEGIIGLLVGMPTAWALRRFYGDQATARSLRAVPAAVLYLVAFSKQLLVANVVVAWIVLSPSMTIDPAVVKLPLRVRSDAAVTTIANSISLTPGTVTMDYDEDTNSLYVHSIDVSDRDEVVEPIRTWEDYALAIFDEELKPGDPVPRRPATDGGGIGDDADRRLGNDGSDTRAWVTDEPESRDAVTDESRRRGSAADESGVRDPADGSTEPERGETDG